jgi:hypothetical protein
VATPEKIKIDDDDDDDDEDKKNEDIVGSAPAAH